MNHLDLFSGIGGFSLAADWIWQDDHNIVAFVEQDKYCQKILSKHWPDVPIFDDIKEFSYEKQETIDLLTGGFPCQPFSIAGIQKGAADDRALWPQMFRIIQEAGPTWIIGENVTGIINMELDNCITQLESEGYEVQAFNIPACGLDAKHRRERIWIVANSGCGNQGQCGDSLQTVTKRYSQKKPTDSIGRSGLYVPNANGHGCGGILRETRQGKDSDQQRKDFNREDSGTRRSGSSCETVADTDSSGSQSKRSKGIKKIIYKGDEIPRSETSQFCGSWQAEPNVGRVANGISFRVDRLKALGNAIVPQVVMPIMQAIKEINLLK